MCSGKLWKQHPPCVCKPPRMQTRAYICLSHYIHPSHIYTYSTHTHTHIQQKDKEKEGTIRCGLAPQALQLSLCLCLAPAPTHPPPDIPNQISVQVLGTRSPSADQAGPTAASTPHPCLLSTCVCLQHRSKPSGMFPLSQPGGCGSSASLHWSLGGHSLPS